MNFTSKYWVTIGTALWLLGAFPAANAESLLNRPATARGDAAKTLVVYSETCAPYSLANDLVALKLLLRRVASRLEVVPLAQVDTNKIAAADYIVIFCPQPPPDFPPEILQAVAQSLHPVLWVGYGADQLSQLPEFKSRFSVAPFAAGRSADTVNYLGRDWRVNTPVWFPVQMSATSANAGIVMSLPLETGGQKVLTPVCWRSGPVTFFTALPTTTANSVLFSDILLDFFGASASASAVCVRIDGYHCHQDHQEFRHLVEYLHERGRPFIVGVIPAYWNPEIKKLQELDTQPEFVAALRYAQKNGGRLVVQGYANTRRAGTGQEPEFWDAVHDRPFADDSAEFVRERILQSVRQMLKHGLFPIAWETPFNSASRTDYAEIASHFSTAVERVQLSDATGLENFAGSAVTQDDFGRLIVPENLGALTEQIKAKALEAIQARAELLARLRGTVATLSFPAYLTEDKLVAATRILERLKLPFLDLADGDHWVQLPEVILLTGKAQRPVTLKDAFIKWKAFDLAGNLVDQDKGVGPVSGERIFRRRGKGDYELFEIIEAQP